MGTQLRIEPHGFKGGPGCTTAACDRALPRALHQTSLTPGERGSTPAPPECGPQADPGEERRETAGVPQTGSEPGPSGTSRSSAMKHPDPSDDSCHPALPFLGQQLRLQRWDRPSCPEDRGGVGHKPGPLPEERLSGHRKPPGPAEFPGPQLKEAAYSGLTFEFSEFLSLGENLSAPVRGR